MSNPKATKHDKEKPRTDLLPARPLLDVAAVFGYGAKEYSDYNYLIGDGLDHNRIYGAILRHLFKYAAGEDVDDESGLSHLAHAGASILMLMHLRSEGKGRDTRYSKLNIE